MFNCFYVCVAYYVERSILEKIKWDEVWVLSLDKIIKVFDSKRKKFIFILKKVRKQMVL